MDTDTDTSEREEYLHVMAEIRAIRRVLLPFVVAFVAATLACAVLLSR